MSKLAELSDQLAQEALDLEEATGDEDAVKRVAESLGASSPTMEETFLTAIRIRRAERRARRVIQKMKAAAAPKPASAAQPDAKAAPPAAARPEAAAPQQKLAAPPKPANTQPITRTLGHPAPNLPRRP